MKKLLILVVSIYISSSCSQKNNPDLEWMKNGTLHKKLIFEWKTASDENKLATCADFIANLKKADHEKYKSIEEMKSDADNLKICIDEGIANNNYADNMKTSEVAVLCYVLMKPH
ncbi:hypothetical protein SD427_14095 [Chryseobacterium sp. JJR-5R]|uniref:hypothetical protein n=1 Tax=Chryseobacterium sp. JJR-5R TaxID=3093923 RepID=UPI002A7511FC|nr:hypothetical protein [Chryseobacterium sp. JJR-5R]WPO81891.1 hypothetical protein SD427_14095 [Chryseobacterium sp. JJR-5R]